MWGRARAVARETVAGTVVQRCHLIPLPKADSWCHGAHSRPSARLGVRCLDAITRDRLEALREADTIVCEESFYSFKRIALTKGSCANVCGIPFVLLFG